MIGVITERDDPTTAAPPVSATTEPGGLGSGTGAPTTQASRTAAASPSAPAPAATLTATNNREFAKVLQADYCDDRIDAFATKHEGQTVEFAGIILDMARRGDTKTGYNILVAPGNTVEATEGPLFRYEDVNTSDFGWTGSDIPNTVGKGSKLLFAAEVGDYDIDRCLLSMTPVATRAR